MDLIEIQSQSHLPDLVNSHTTLWSGSCYCNDVYKKSQSHLTDLVNFHPWRGYLRVEAVHDYTASQSRLTDLIISDAYAGRTDSPALRIIGSQSHLTDLVNFR